MRDLSPETDRRRQCGGWFHQYRYRSHSSSGRLSAALSASAVLNLVIRAEVIGYDDYIAGNGEQGAKEAGCLRLEGKEYIVREGDVMLFRFNV